MILVQQNNLTISQVYIMERQFSRKIFKQKKVPVAKSDTLNKLHAQSNLLP